VKGRIRIRIKVKSSIRFRIRINVMRICNSAYKRVSDLFHRIGLILPSLFHPPVFQIISASIGFITSSVSRAVFSIARAGYCGVHYGWMGNLGVLASHPASQQTVNVCPHGTKHCLQLQVISKKSCCLNDGGSRLYRCVPKALYSLFLFDFKSFSI
jgi:hypothetical protein